MEKRYRYCGICDEMVSLCPHFDNGFPLPSKEQEPAAPAPSPEARAPVLGGAEAIEAFFQRERAAHEANPGSLVLLPFSAVVAAGAHATVVCQPYTTPCRLVRLVYGGPPMTFMLTDIAIGKNSQTGAPGEIWMDCFPPHPEGGQPIDNLDGLIDVVHRGMMVILRIRNVTSAMASFGSIIYARAPQRTGGRMP